MKVAWTRGFCDWLENHLRVPNEHSYVLFQIHPDIVILDLFMGVADAWQQLAPYCPGAMLVVPGRFTSRTTAERMGARLFIGQTHHQSVASAVIELAKLSNQRD